LTLLELVMVVSILAILTALIVPGMGDQQEETRKTVARATLHELRDVIANRYMQDMANTANVSTTSTVGRIALPQPDRANDVSGRISTTAIQADGSTGGIVPQLHFLFVNPHYHSSSTPPYVAVSDYDAQTRIGWNGPYVGQKMTLYPNPGNPRFPQDPNNANDWSDYGFTERYGQAGDFCVNDPWGSPYVIHVRLNGTVYTAYVVSAGPNRKLDTGTWNNSGDGGSLNSGDDLALAIKSWM
jgi:type II secretory pathway pseudopilin PulG